ncbi:Protein stoned-B [Taenia crassiceps]|uniref:Protein stoned-B n=1 Tax=Taenia crassiceps TaxID=6207 RepID=A0ABR4QFR8_9CEST
MSRDRVNPITYLVRRLSKTLSLNRGSITNTDLENFEEYVHHPHVRLPSVTRERTSRSVDRSRKGGIPARSASACPAPLATADCFDITDVSDVEVGSKDQLSDSKAEAESEDDSVSPTSYSDSEETQSVDKSEEEPVFTYSGTPTDQIYDFNYPEILRDESESSLASTIHKSHSSSSSNSTDMIYSKESSSEGEVEKFELEETEISEGQSTEMCKGDNNEENSYREVYQDSYEDYNYPQFEVQHDPQQDPFHEATLIAERQKQFSPPNQLYMNTSPPAILVTSPSNHDITQKSPSRPPPPVTKPVPPPVPPPPREVQHHPPEPTRPLPPRPSSRPEPSTSEAPTSPARKKKHKIFGISIGPLPSDPDPSFPFESHFEKKRIVPNPKKVLQNIIGGEKRKQRLKRKEEAELERIIKSQPARVARKEAAEHNSSQKGYLLDWREFQARIEAKVTDTASRLESLKWTADTTDEKSKSETSSWANFEAHQEPQVEVNWAEFESIEDPNELTNQEASSEDSVQEEPIVLEIGNSVQENEWAAFDDLQRGDHSTQEEGTDFFIPLGNNWTSTVGAAPTGSGDNWANFCHTDFLNSKNWVTEVPSNNDQASFASSETNKNLDLPLDKSLTQDPQMSDLNLVETEDTKAQSSNSIPFSEQELPQIKDNLDEKYDFLVRAETAQEVSSIRQEADTAVTAIESTLDNQQVEEKSELPKVTQNSQSSSLDREFSTLNQTQHYGYDDPSQVTTKIYQSSLEEPTIIEGPSLLSFSTDRENLKDYHYDNRCDSDLSVNTQPQPPQYDNSYGYDEVKVDRASLTEDSGMARSDVKDFVSDVINTAESETTKKLHAEIVELYTNSAKPKPRAVRQGTLTENNPFRRTLRTEDFENTDQELNPEQLAIEDEKTTLATVALFSQSVHEEDEEMEESARGYVIEERPETPTNQSFDPFQTIYPASEKDSSSDVEEDKSSHAVPQVSIKEKEVNDYNPHEETTIFPILPAPPRTEVPAYTDELASNDIDDGFGKGISEKTDNLESLAVQSSTPLGWETFTSDSNTVDNVNATDDELNKAFEVDWSKPPVPTAPVPEPPRPETPDPDLEIPFNPPAPTNQVWRLWIRYPEKKKKMKQMTKYTTDRSWKEIAVTLSDDRGRCEVNLHDIDPNEKDYVKEPYRTLRMEPYMQLSRCKLQQYDKYGKLNIFKINHVSYRELPGMRPEKFSIKTFQNLISHKPKQNVTLDHIPVYTEILKFGSMDRTLMRSLMSVLEDSLMRIPAHKDEGLNYTHEEVCCYVVDEYVGRLSVNGIIEEQKARTRVFCSAFVNGGPHIVLGINDKWRFGREIVRRSDILPVMHDDWITIWKPEFHSCLEMGDYESDHLLKFYPLDGCKFELMRFRVSLRHNQELPMQVHCSYSIDDRKISMRCELLVPGYFTATGRSGAIPCEDVEIRIPVPEEWIYHFRFEKHHKMGSVHSTLRKPGRIKGLERITQMAQSLLPPSLLEASIGSAKYEHLFKAIVWRIPRVPEKNEASYRPHLLTCNLLLNAHDTVPKWDALMKDVHIEFGMPSSTISGTTVRSISVETTGVAEKFVKYTARYRLTKAIDYQLGHRKDKPLKGILDAETEEPTSPSGSESEREEATENAEVSQELKCRTEESGVVVDDLLGEGLNETTLPHSQIALKPDAAQSEELVGIFG